MLYGAMGTQWLKQTFITFEVRQMDRDGLKKNWRERQAHSGITVISDEQSNNLQTVA